MLPHLYICWTFIYLLKAPKEAVPVQIWALQKGLSTYTAEIQTLVAAGYIKKLDPREENILTKWYVPHHIVTHNEKNRVVFNCSFNFKGENLNCLLLPVPTLGPSLLVVLLMFLEHAVAISNNICSIFHQVKPLPEDQPLLRFLWRDLKMKSHPPSMNCTFGTTSSPCSATFALQKHIIDHHSEDIGEVILRLFYVHSCLQSLLSEEEDKTLVEELQDILASGPSK